MERGVLRLRNLRRVVEEGPISIVSWRVSIRNLYEKITMIPEHPYRMAAPQKELATPKTLPRYPPSSGPRTDPAEDMKFMTPKTVPRTSGATA